MTTSLSSRLPLALTALTSLALAWPLADKPSFIAASEAIKAATAAAIAAHEAARDVGGQLGTRETGTAFVARLLA
jgi:3-isopropylmalate dehydrogenase